MKINKKIDNNIIYSVYTGSDNGFSGPFATTITNIQI